MRQLRDLDQQILRTIELATRLSGKDTLLHHFRSRADVGEHPADEWFYYALTAWRLMERTGHTQRKHQYLCGALEGLDRSCALDSAHWPAVFLRSTICTMLSGDDVVEMVAYLLPTDYTVEDAAADRLRMLELQRSAPAAPEFFVTYAACALEALDDGRIDEAHEFVRAGLRETPAGRVRALAGMLTIPVALLLDKLETQPSLRADVRRRYAKLFGQG